MRQRYIGGKNISLYTLCNDILCIASLLYEHESIPWSTKRKYMYSCVIQYPFVTHFDWQDEIVNMSKLFCLQWLGPKYASFCITSKLCIINCYLWRQYVLTLYLMSVLMIENWITGLRSIASGFIKAYTAQFSLYSCKFCSVIEFVPLMNMKVHVLTMYMDVHAPPAVAGCAVLSLERPSCRIVWCRPPSVALQCSSTYWTFSGMYFYSTDFLT